MMALDTPLLTRRLLQDDAAQHQRVKAFFKSAVNVGMNTAVRRQACLSNGVCS
jgi:predicted nucleic-acid-binding protein